jgi:Domain of unknown function (DUF4878)
MKTKRVLLVALIFITACNSLSSSPTTVVRRFIANSESGDVNGMMQLFAKKAIQEKGHEKVRSNNQAFADLVEKVRGQGKTLKIEGLKESVNNETATVTFFYGDREKNDSVPLSFSLVKENGEWKVYDVGPAQ